MGTRKSLGPGFRALYAGALVSNTGDGIRLAALPLLAATLTTSPLLISTVTAAQYLPWLTFGPFGGALVDRWERRRTILTTQAWRGLVMASLAVLVWTDHACVVAFLITLGEILVDPSTVALVPTLVDDVDLERANGRIASVEIVSNDFAGAPVGSALFAFAPWLPFLVDGASYLGSVLPFRQLPRQPHHAPPETVSTRTVRADAADGFRWLRRHRVLGPFTIAQVIYCFGFAASYSLLVVFVTTSSTRPPSLSASSWPRVLQVRSSAHSRELESPRPSGPVRPWPVPSPCRAPRLSLLQLRLRCRWRQRSGFSTGSQPGLNARSRRVCSSGSHRTISLDGSTSRPGSSPGEPS